MPGVKILPNDEIWREQLAKELEGKEISSVDIRGYLSRADPPEGEEKYMHWRRTGFYTITILAEDPEASGQYTQLRKFWEKTGLVKGIAE